MNANAQGSAATRATPRPCRRRVPYSALAATTMMAISGAAHALPAPLDPPALAAWSDQVFGAALARGRFSGMALIVVAGDAVVLEKAYGYADWPARVPIDPGKTEFLLGSISKTFTATSIAQLLERRQIRSLDEPVNAYAKRVKLPGADGARVTFWNLLTHSAGFEQKSSGLASYEAAALPLPAAALARYVTKIVRPPGTYSAYSNFGTGLLATVVEDVSGMQIDDYVRQNILQPLGMQHSRMNVSPSRPDNLVHAYQMGPSGAITELPWLPFSAFAGPVGGISATPRDMAQYIKAHLATGEFEAKNILSAESLALMHAPKFGNHPDAMNFGMCWFVSQWNGEHLVEHGGIWPYNYSMLTLLPDSKLGIYIATVGDGSAAPFMPAYEARALLLTKLLGRQAYAEVTPLPSSLEEYVGDYQQISGSRSTLEAVVDLAQAGSGDRDTNDIVKAVRLDGHGGLRIAGSAGWTPIGADRFWKKDFEPGPAFSGPLYAFGRDRAGRIDRMTNYFGMDTNLKVGPIANLANRARLAMLLGGVLLSGVLALAWTAGSPLERAARWLAVMGAGLVLLLPRVLFGVSAPGGFSYYLLAGQTGRWIAFAALANALAVIVAVLGWTTFRSFGTAPLAGWRARATRWHRALFVLSGAGLVGLLATVNALGFRIP